jgi:opacity protein-like surface antigen
LVFGGCLAACGRNEGNELRSCESKNLGTVDRKRDLPNLSHDPRSSIIVKSTLGLLALAAAGLFVVPIIAKAQGTEGAFISGNVGSASIDSGPIDGNDTSYGANAGYRWAVSPRTLVGFEAGYVGLGSYSNLTIISSTQLTPIGEPPADPEIYTVSVTNKMRGLTIGASGRFNLSPNWYVGGRAGFLRASFASRVRIVELDAPLVPNKDFNADGWYAGGGFGYDFSNNFSLGINYDYYSASSYGFNYDPNVVSVSGEYRF